MLYCKELNYIWLYRTFGRFPYNSLYKTIKDVPIVSGTTACIDKGRTTNILNIYEALFHGNKLDHGLINSN